MTLVSPLLDGLTMGQPVNQHHGIQCCPALNEETNTRYMVKIISIPASQRQMEALLLTGAFPNELKAQEYFAQLADTVVQEAELLARLSRAEGYLAYQGSQIIKMQEGVGFEVYLLAQYRESLEDQIRHTPITHLDAVNLGLDMCAALAVSRRSGYLYLNLKPANIYKTEHRGFCIGDLGFLKLSSLGFASFPEKYRGPYTAPEIQDAMSPMNETLDIYALGLSLYQVYNNGQLPELDDQPLPPPLYADYEMSQIILKACAVNPADRWQTPDQMGQALVDYMQRNSVNAVSIIPEPVEFPQEQVLQEEFLTEEENAAELATLLAMIPDELPPVPVEQTPNPEVDAAAETEEVSFDEEPASDAITEEGVTVEVAQMLAQADALIEHELPEPAVAPDPIDVPIPPPIVPEPEIVEEADETPDEPIPDEVPPDPEEDKEEDEDMPEEPARKKISLGTIIKLAAVALVVIAMTLFGIYYYNNVYTQTIDGLHISGAEDQIVVRVETSSGNSNLIVTCTDAYGNSVQSPLTSGVALFNNMKPDTHYKIEVSSTGRNKLVGQTTGTYTTGSQTKISNFIATPGIEDGTVTLSFDVTGPDSKEWKLEYAATNIPVQSVTFTGHSMEFKGLNVGSVYTFRLSPVDTLYMAGETTMEYTVTGTILAEDLTISAYYTDFLSVTWKAPQDVFGTNWIVRCYNDQGYDQTIETTATTQIFSRLEGEGVYTIVVTAEGVAKSVSITTEGMTPIESVIPNPDVGDNDTPDNPDVGGNDTPDNPDVGGNDSPDHPDVGGNDTPDNPDVGGNDTPDNPDVGGNDTPDNPDVGGNDTPDNPDVGGNDTPDNPDVGGNDTPDKPVNPNILTITGYSASFSSVSWNMELTWNYTGPQPSGWILTYTTNGKNPITVKCSQNYTNILLVTGNTYEFEVRPADNTKYVTKKWTYSSKELKYYNANGFDAKQEKFSLVSGESNDPVTDFKIGDKVYLYVDSDKVDSTATDTVKVTYVIGDANNNLLSADSVKVKWIELWQDDVCNVLIPQLPYIPGAYAVDLYFVYVLVTAQNFKIS